MKILVTGGAGFIGSHIVEHFHKDAEVVVLDNFRSGFRKNIEKFNVKLIEGSITDAGLVSKSTKKVDYIFHLAALISVPESVEKPNECVEINTIGTLNLIKAAKQNGVKKIIFSTSAAIYGDDPALPKKETMPPCPKSPYAVTKLDGEYYLSLYSQQWGVNSACLRYFNVFGPRQNPESQYAAAIPIFIAKALKNEDITIFGDGEQTRDFIYVRDVVNANVLAMRKGSGVYNVACGSKISINDLAIKIISLTGSKSRIIHASERAGDVKYSYADIAKIKELDFSPKFNQDDGLKATIDYFSVSRHCER